MATPPIARPVHSRGEGARAPVVPWVVLAWSAAAVGLGLGWWSGVLPRGVPEGPSFGSLFSAAGLGVASVTVIGFGCAGAVCAVVLLRRVGGRWAQVAAWSLAAAVLLVFVDGSLLALLGYTMIVPVVGWFMPGLLSAYVSAALEPTALTLLFCAVGVVVWALAALTHGRAVRGACRRCGRDEHWNPERERSVRARALRVGRWAVGVGVVLALLYPALRVLWLFGVALDFGEEETRQMLSDPYVLATGLSLGSAGVVGAALMLGLVQRWGVRFPRWTVGLAGRRVPVALAVVPASLVTVALVAMGRSTVVQLVIGSAGATPVTEPVHATVFALMGVWGAALGVATAAYAVRRRAECDGCGRGLPEVEPARGPVGPAAAG
ncbi:hypothetical protein KIK06_07120 [Nocardiopsis sp. EMB25]|uniref:hypothetical protein n=1 Tax=Nocardiopsis sp. EMB25 TaxID=2835867 RepID=UPI002284218B|nr:hypothetical protein [Nocardiopsis sp. EMB25]MCY9783661.1 hypothetical protein [Nocardiopsis sp. EMB25]